jgi:AmpD protein
MIKLVEFLALAGFFYWFFLYRPQKAKRVKEQARQDAELLAQKKQAQQAEQVEQIVSCNYCAIHLPISDAITHQTRYFCSLAHADSIDVKGWLGYAKSLPSPNHDPRPLESKIDTVVIHHISLPDGQFGGSSIEEFFTNQLREEDHPFFKEIAHLQVSAHFLIKRGGELCQFVSCLERAWHAGESVLLGRQRCNDFSIGIELEGTGDISFEQAQYLALAKLLGVYKSNTP